MTDSTNDWATEAAKQQNRSEAMIGLQLLKRTSDKRSWNLAAFHSPHSLTWSWILGFSFFAQGEARVRPLGYYYRDNNGIQWGLRIPFIGMVRWSRQKPMWFRELYYRREKD